MLHFLKRAIQIVGSVFTILLLLSILINVWDEPLKPEVKAIFNWQLPPNAYNDNGFIMLFGFDAPLNTDAYAFGKKAVEAGVSDYFVSKQSHTEPEYKPDNNPDPYPDWKNFRCDYKAQQNCVEFYLRQDQNKLVGVLASQQPLENRFNAFKSSQHFVEVIPPMMLMKLPKYQHLLNASEFIRMKAILQIAQGKEPEGMIQLIENAKFSRKFLQNANCLISYMIGIVLIERDTRILSELITKYPKLATIYQAPIATVLAPVSTPKFSMKKAFIYERDLKVHYVDKLKYSMLDAINIEQSRLKNMLSRLFIQLNGTVNLFYEQGSLLLLIADSDAAHLDEIYQQTETKQESLLGTGIPPIYYINPIGKILAQVGSYDSKKYFERQHDADSYLTLVRLQLEIASNILKDETKIKELLLKFPNPYTGKSFDFDPTTKKITFKGREVSNVTFDGTNVFEVKINI